jgi:hypothetical protein
MPEGTIVHMRDSYARKNAQQKIFEHRVIVILRTIIFYVKKKAFEMQRTAK